MHPAVKTVNHESIPTHTASGVLRRRSGLIYSPTSQACLFETQWRGASGANHRRRRLRSDARSALPGDSGTPRDSVTPRDPKRDNRDEVAILRQRVDEQSAKLDAILADQVKLLALLHAQFK